MEEPDVHFSSPQFTLCKFLFLLIPFSNTTGHAYYVGAISFTNSRIKIDLFALAPRIRPQLVCSDLMQNSQQVQHITDSVSVEKATMSTRLMKSNHLAVAMKLSCSNFKSVREFGSHRMSFTVIGIRFPLSRPHTTHYNSFNTLSKVFISNTGDTFAHLATTFCRVVLLTWIIGIAKIQNLCKFSPRYTTYDCSVSGFHQLTS